jgi:hypothetical protein
MFSNERPSPYGDQRNHPNFSSGPKPPSNEDTLRTEKLQIERKNFIFTLKENPRGRFLRITEDVGGRRDMIIIPAPGLAEFREVLEEMVRTAEELPPHESESNPPEE